MTEPRIQGQPAPWREAARQELQLEADQLRGPSANELKRIQAQKTLESGVAGLIQSAASNLAGELGSVAGGIAGGAVAAYASVGSTLITLVRGYATSVQEGDQLNEAHRRDAVNQATLWLAAGALPNDFVHARNLEYAASGSVAGQGQGPSNRIINSLLGSGKFDEARRLAEQQASAGRDFACKLDITSEAALERRLANDRGFAALYDHDDATAFRLGVQSVIFEAQHPARDAGGST
jgi:hypothetical protein